METIVIFPTNLAGAHPKKFLKEHGAIRGESEGLMGSCYAIPIKDKYGNPLAQSRIEISVRTCKEYLSQEGKTYIFDDSFPLNLR